jgi:hypothetical protein
LPHEHCSLPPGSGGADALIASNVSRFVWRKLTTAIIAFHTAILTAHEKAVMGDYLLVGRNTARAKTLTNVKEGGHTDAHFEHLSRNADCSLSHRMP